MKRLVRRDDRMAEITVESEMAEVLQSLTGGLINPVSSILSVDSSNVANNASVILQFHDLE